jgi:hypothetical protein
MHDGSNTHKKWSGRQSFRFQLCPLWRPHLYCYRFLSFAQHEMNTGEGLWDPWLNNTYIVSLFDPFSIQNNTIAG